MLHKSLDAPLGPGTPGGPRRVSGWPPMSYPQTQASRVRAQGLARWAPPSFPLDACIACVSVLWCLAHGPRPPSEAPAAAPQCGASMPQGMPAAGDAIAHAPLTYEHATPRTQWSIGSHSTRWTWHALGALPRPRMAVACCPLRTRIAPACAERAALQRTPGSTHASRGSLHLS